MCVVSSMLDLGGIAVNAELKRSGVPIFLGAYGDRLRSGWGESCALISRGLLTLSPQYTINYQLAPHLSSSHL